jgi:hypothetical protein
MRGWFLASLALIFVVTNGSLANAFCDTDMVIIRGRVEHRPRKAMVRVQLVYPKQKLGESGEITIDKEKFTIQIPFFTQSRAPKLTGRLFEKCNRKPQTVIVTLSESDQNLEHDRISLDLVKDFQMADPSAYTPRSEIVLRGPD